MSKIKDIIEKLQATGNEYYDLHLLITKRVWLVVASLYYLSYLFTVGGYYFGPITLDYLAMITFHIYSILVIATAWFFYSLCEYATAIYIPNQKWIKVIPITIGLLFAITALLVHLGII